MEVFDPLPCVTTAVHDQPVASHREPLIPGLPRGRQDHSAQQRFVLDTHLVQRPKMAPWDDQEVLRCGGGDVAYDDDLVVLVKALTRQLAAHDATE